MALWINSLLLVKLLKVNRLYLATLLICLALPKKKNFGMRVVLWFLLSQVLAFAFPVANYSLVYVSTMFSIVSLGSACGCKLCFKLDWKSVLFIAAAALGLEHMASMADSLISCLWPDTFPTLRSGAISIPTLLNYLCATLLVDTWFCLVFIRKKKALGVEHMKHKHVISILLLSLSFNVYFNLLYVQLTNLHDFWASLFSYTTNIFISSLLLSLQYFILNEQRIQTRLQMSELLREQAREQFETSRDTYEAICMKCHDLKHRLLAYQKQVKDGEFDDIMDLIESYGTEIKTGNDVLDVVFQEKNFQCKKQGIQFTCIIDGKILAFLESVDLYVLFGNLLDNCIEAVVKLPESVAKIIHVTVSHQKGFVIITTENGFVGELQWSDGRLHTSKNDEVHHGIGLLSIENIVKKYGGWYDITTEDNIFCISIAFPDHTSYATSK